MTAMNGRLPRVPISRRGCATSPEPSRGDFLFGDRPSVADYYVLTMVLWAARFSVEVPPALAAIADRLKAMPAVQATLKAG